MKLDFFKYHGTGNDFILIDNRDGQFIPETAMVALLCDRRFGIGADGLILLNRVDGYDFAMKYYNSDGRESTMCGNGGRCLVAFADFLSVSVGKSRFISIDGVHEGEVLSKADQQYQVKLSLQNVTGYGLREGDYIIDTGSPHYARFVEDVEKIDVVKEGRFIRNLPDFSPGGINVNFVQQFGSKLYVRTYERGVEDETLSCGTGVTASALAFAALKDLNSGPLPVRTRGGDLAIHFKKSGNGFNDIFIEGPAVQVFTGTIDTKSLVPGIK